MKKGYKKKTAKRGYVDFVEKCICADKNISNLDYGGGGDNLSHPYTHVFGKTFVAASVTKKSIPALLAKIFWQRVF